MKCNYHSKSKSAFNRCMNIFILIAFISNVIMPSVGYAQTIPSPTPQTVLDLPIPGKMISASNDYIPTMIKGITVHPENPLELDFIINNGNSHLHGEALEKESIKLIKYFLASLTVPEDELWVNLSPYEEGKIISKSFGKTEMGRDLLAQDYILKQLTASLMYPEDELGTRFWERVYEKAFELYGTIDIPMNTFNKVWIVPQEAVVYEKGKSAFVIKSKLKVMLNEDYVALRKNAGNTDFGTTEIAQERMTEISQVTSNVVREILIPEIEKEVNEGKNFANLRQIYDSMILAAWFKVNLKESLLGHVYVDKGKTRGVDTKDRTVNQKIYETYLEAFRKGAYDFVGEEYDPGSQQIIERKYFSGGVITRDQNGKNLTQKVLETRIVEDEGLTEEQEEAVRESAQESEESTDSISMKINLQEINRQNEKAVEGLAQKASQARDSQSDQLMAVEGKKKSAKRKSKYDLLRQNHQKSANALYKIISKIDVKKIPRQTKILKERLERLEALKRVKIEKDYVEMIETSLEIIKSMIRQGIDKEKLSPVIPKLLRTSVYLSDYHKSYKIINGFPHQDKLDENELKVKNEVASTLIMMGPAVIKPTLNTIKNKLNSDEGLSDQEDLSAVLIGLKALSVDPIIKEITAIRVFNHNSVPRIRLLDEVLTKIGTANNIKIKAEKTTVKKLLQIAIKLKEFDAHNDVNFSDVIVRTSKVGLQALSDSINDLKGEKPVTVEKVADLVHVFPDIDKIDAPPEAYKPLIKPLLTFLYDLYEEVELEDNGFYNAFALFW